MNRRGLMLLCAFVAGIVGLLLWEFEFQHLSLVLWFLVVVAVLWCCAEIAVSLHVLPSPRRRNARVSQRRRSRRSHWVEMLVGAVILGAIAIILRILGFETTGQLIWFLVVVALLWGCAQVSLLLRPEERERLPQSVDDERAVSESWVGGRPRSIAERLFPGSSMQSGFYNTSNEEIWDSNEKLPPHPSY